LLSLVNVTNVFSTVCYFVVTLLFYGLLKPVGGILSLLAALCSLGGCIVMSLGLFHLDSPVSPLLFFGPFCLLIGYLIFKSNFLPRILGVAMAIAGLGWLAFLLPAVPNSLSIAIKIFGFLAELSLCLWLLVMGVNVERWKRLNDTRLYRCLDRILPHKTKLERHLKERYGVLFGAEFDVLLYDLTSTYVEGAAEKNPMVRRGYSRDHRPDCEQLVIALIVNNEGFPFSYETFDGNRSDVSTMETMLRMVERKYGKARRIWVFDRGIVSEENLAAIRKRGGQYLTGTPRSQMKRFEEELLKDDWTRVRPEVEVKKVAIPQGEETYILCRTAGRKEKEKAIRSRFSNRMETALHELERAIVTGRLKDRNKMERRLGKIQARHPQVNDLYDLDLRETADGVRLFWQIREDRRNWREAREGAYLLRTNLAAETAEELWSKYMQLTEAEASFRALKSELSIRPLFHQLEPRVKAHVMVAFG
jgi:transposase